MHISMPYIIFFVYLEMGLRALARFYIPISFAIASFGIRMAMAADESGRCPVALDSAVAILTGQKRAASRP